MKNSIIWLLGAALIVIGLVWINKQGGQTAPGQQATSFATVSDAVARGAKLYDVRTAQEFSEGHFAHATNWSLQDIQAGKLPDVPKDTRIYLYCRSGNRSAQAAGVLKGAGYTNVTDLGGLPDMQAMGATLER